MAPPDIDAFRERVIRAFPPRIFDALISTHGECDDGIAVRNNLFGKRWDELSPEVLFHGSIALPLLEPPALAAFLPAWLVRSMETFGEDNTVLEFTLCSLCPGDPDEGWRDYRIAEMIAPFNAAQRNVVGEFLRSVLNCGATPNLHAYAEHGLRYWCT